MNFVHFCPPSTSQDPKALKGKSLSLLSPLMCCQPREGLIQRSVCKGNIPPPSKPPVPPPLPTASSPPPPSISFAHFSFEPTLLHSLHCVSSFIISKGEKIKLFALSLSPFLAVCLCLFWHPRQFHPFYPSRVSVSPDIDNATHTWEATVVSISDVSGTKMREAVFANVLHWLVLTDY